MTLVGRDSMFYCSQGYNVLIHIYLHSMNEVIVTNLILIIIMIVYIFFVHSKSSIELVSWPDCFGFLKLLFLAFYQPFLIRFLLGCSAGLCLVASVPKALRFLMMSSVRFISCRSFLVSSGH